MRATLNGKRRPKLRWRLAGEQNWRCCYCHGDMTPETGKPNTATIEHVVPLSQGGRSVYDNMVAACADCNVREGRRHDPRRPRRATLGDVWPVQNEA